MILAYHLILSRYGFWLPNDPRGSSSDWVASWDLFRYGPATKVDTSESLAHVPHDRALRRAAKEALKYPPVQLNGTQARAVGRGFALAAEEGGYDVFACAVLPDHDHLVIGRHARSIGRIVGHLKARATQQLQREGLHPLADYADDEGAIPSPWARLYWKVFIDSSGWVRAAVRYVEKNPVKEGKRRQKWSVVVPYPG